MTDAYACNDAALIASLEGFGALPEIFRALAAGQRVNLSELTDVAGSSTADLGRVLRLEPGTEWDDDGRLVGFGLTPSPTAHRLLVGGRTLYTWCASDTLFFTIILRRRAVAESRCAATGTPIRLEVTPGGVESATPPGAMVSQRHGAEKAGNLRADLCDHGHFFASASAASAWAAEHHDGRLLTIDEAFDECRSSCEQLGWI